jgi:hypothetical protein
MDKIDTMTTTTTMTTIEAEGIHHWLSQLFGLKNTLRDPGGALAAHLFCS